MSYIIPIGPYHPALEEPVHARLFTEGEVIKDAEVFVGYNHRGIEKLATERNAIQTLCWSSVSAASARTPMPSRTPSPWKN